MSSRPTALIDVLPEPMALVARDGCILVANAAFAALVGATLSELKGKSFFDFVSSRDAVREYLRYCSSTSGPTFGSVTFAASKEPFRCEGGLLYGFSADGDDCLWLRFVPRNIAVRQFSCLTDQIDTLTHEISARMRSDAESREATDRLAFLGQATAILASSLDYNFTLPAIARLAVPRFADWCGIALLEPDGRLLSVATYHPDPAKRALAEEWNRRYPPDPDARHGAANVVRTGATEIMTNIPDSLLAEAAADDEQLRVLRELGLKSYICVPLKARDKIMGALTLITAESERRYSEKDIDLLEDLGRRCAVAVDNAQLYSEAVRASSLLHAVLQQMPVGVVIAEAPSGRIMFNSDTHQAIMGKGFKAAGNVHEFHRHAPVFPGVAPSDLPLARALRGEMVPELDLQFIRTDGERRVMRTSSTPVFDEQGNVIAAVSVFQDVTEKLAADDALRKSEKLAAAGRFAATIAHEINNPLEAATNLVYLAKAGAAGEQLQFLEMAEHELLRVAQIARKTLGFYKDATVARTFDVGRAAEHVANFYHRHAEQRGIRLVSRVREAYIRASETEFQQVLSNLLANAIDACPGGACITLRVAVIGSRVRITVADTGSGIPPANLGRIWEPFFTTKQQTGTGLGLWVTRDLVHKNDGRITLRTRHGRQPSGTVFSISFPVAVAQVTAAAS